MAWTRSVMRHILSPTFVSGSAHVSCLILLDGLTPRIAAFLYLELFSTVLEHPTKNNLIIPLPITVVLFILVEASNIRLRSSVSFACQAQREVCRMAFTERITTV